MWLGECCWTPTPATVTAPCGRTFTVCMECDKGINQCTEGYCRHKKESANDH